MVLHHRNKASGTSGSAKSGLGSVAITAASEVNMVLTRNEENGERQIFVPDNRYPHFMGGVTFEGQRVNCDKDTGYVWLSRAETKETKKAQAITVAASLIIKFLQDHPEGVSKKTIKDSIPKDKTTVTNALDKGLTQGIFWLDPDHKIGGSPSVKLSPRFVAGSVEDLPTAMQEPAQR
jgi:hypothetical protein